jgi:hypothetical protein
LTMFWAIIARRTLVSDEVLISASSEDEARRKAAALAETYAFTAEPDVNTYVESVIEADCRSYMRT